MGTREEQRLWQAVLLRSLRDAVNLGIYEDGAISISHRRRLKEEARSWLLGANKDFFTVCQMAGLDPEYTRERVVSFLESANLGNIAQNHVIMLSETTCGHPEQAISLPLPDAPWEASQPPMTGPKP